MAGVYGRRKCSVCGNWFDDNADAEHCSMECFGETVHRAVLEDNPDLKEIFDKIEREENGHPDNN